MDNYTIKKGLNPHQLTMNINMELIKTFKLYIPLRI